MPTISQLPTAEAISATDLVPISQSGAVNAVAVGTLLAQTQPAIIIDPPSLLGRFSVGPGGPDAIAIGEGLNLNNGTLDATGFDPSILALQSNISANDQIIVVNGSTSQLIDLAQVRDLFTAGSNVTIDGSGTISSSISSSSPSYNLATLSTVTALASGDLVGVVQDSQDHTITYANFLDGLTIDDAQPADSASDSDTFWVAQTTNVMLRQTLGSLWPWVLGKLQSWKRIVMELSTNTELDGTVHNNVILVCSSPLSISAVVGNLGSGFSCDLINVSSGQVSLPASIQTSNGSGIISSNQCCTIRCVLYSGGTAAFALIGTGGAIAVVPGQVPNLAAASITSASVDLSWTTPGSGGAVISYGIQYRVTGTTSWVAAGQANGSTNFVVQSLQAATSYDFIIFATNTVGNGPSSSALTVETSSGGAVPGAPTVTTTSDVTANTLTCSWTAPTAGGAATAYTVQYSISGQNTWNTAVNNLSTTSTTITNLTAATSYLIQVIASNAAGSGPPSTSTSVTTSQSGGLVASISWNLVPVGSYAHGSGAIPVNAQVTPSNATVQFGFSTSPTISPTTWIKAAFVNSNLWGAYVPTPATAGTWYTWAEGMDGSAVTIYATPFTTT